MAKITNKTRAVWAHSGLLTYNEVSEKDCAPDELIDLAADMICDLMHLIKLHGGDPLCKIVNARVNYLCETQGGEDSDTLLEPGGIISQAETLELVRQIAVMNYDGEELEDGEQFVMENDDAVSTLGGLIDSARRLLKSE